MGTFVFRCPGCAGEVSLETTSGEVRCPRCGRGLTHPSGVLDFVSNELRGAERAFYDERPAEPTPLTLADLEQEWRDPRFPVNAAVLARVGDLAGKSVLLLGNGASAKELHFATHRPRALILSDLSAEAVRSVRDRAQLGELARDVWFASIDALDLPLPDASVDLVYGYAFVHHLPELDPFLAEVARVLRPGGRAVFFDDAYSPLWQRAKMTVLRPLMRWAHRRGGISPEDLRFTLQGGFREEDLSRRIRAVGGEPWFERMMFLYYLWRRAGDRALPPRLRRLTQSVPAARAIIALDRRLERFEAVRRNRIRLVWGFDKGG